MLYSRIVIKLLSQDFRKNNIAAKSNYYGKTRLTITDSSMRFING